MSSDVNPDGKVAPPAASLEAARRDALRSEVKAIAEAAAEGSLDAASFEAGIEAIRQIPLDAQTFLDTPHVPADAGVYKDALERIMARIPAGWGRWIDCGPGWYPLLAELDAHLGALIPDYEIHQVKEKYGTLRFYWGVPVTEPGCCVEFKRNDPRPLEGAIHGPLVPPGRSADEQVLLDAWWVRRRAHFESVEHATCTAAIYADAERNREVRHAVGKDAEALVDQAEERAARTCEDCGSLAILREQSGWLRTLCDVCGDRLGYLPVQ